MELGENDLLTKCFVEQSLGDYILFAEHTVYPGFWVVRFSGNQNWQTESKTRFNGLFN